MTGREKLIIGTKWMLENVKQEDIDMDYFMNGCGTSGCWLGWMCCCPALVAEGLTYEMINSIDQRIDEFFNIHGFQWSFLFGPLKSGQKADILQRLHTVLQQPGPYPEPEIANLDQEWKELQRAFERSHDQATNLY